MSRLETCSLEPPPVAGEPQLQSTVLKIEPLPEMECRALTPSEIDETSNVTIIELQISKLETEYRQKRQRLE